MQVRELLHRWAEGNKHTRASVSDLNLLQHSHAGICTYMHFITRLGDLGFCRNILCKREWLALYKHKTDVNMPLICPWILELSLPLHKKYLLQQEQMLLSKISLSESKPKHQIRAIFNDLTCISYFRKGNYIISLLISFHFEALSNHLNSWTKWHRLNADLKTCFVDAYMVAI